jgi:hypothetical protein
VFVPPAVTLLETLSGPVLAVQDTGFVLLNVTFDETTTVVLVSEKFTVVRPDAAAVTV